MCDILTICFESLSAPVLHSDYPFRRRARSGKTSREPVMDLTAAFAFLDSDSDDDEWDDTDATAWDPSLSLAQSDLPPTGACLLDRKTLDRD